MYKYIAIYVYAFLSCVPSQFECLTSFPLLFEKAKTFDDKEVFFLNQINIIFHDIVIRCTHVNKSVQVLTGSEHVTFCGRDNDYTITTTTPIVLPETSI